MKQSPEFFLPGFDVLVTDEGAANVSTLFFFFGSCEQSNHLRRVAANLAHFVPSWQFLDSYHIESKYFVFNSHALSSAGFERSSCSTPDHPHFPAAVITAKKNFRSGPSSGVSLFSNFGITELEIIFCFGVERMLLKQFWTTAFNS